MRGKGCSRSWRSAMRASSVAEMGEQTDNRVVMVTGGFGTLGRAVVRAFETQGARVAAVDRSAAPADNQPSAQLLKLGNVDLAQWAHSAAAVQKVTATFGR